VLKSSVRYKFFIFLIISFIVLLYFSPLADGIIMGVVFAYVAKPVRNRLEKRTGKTASSFISTMLIILPIAFLMFYGVFQGLNQMIYFLTHQKQFEETLVKVLRNAKVPEKYVDYVVSSIPAVESAFRNAIKVSAVNYTVKAVYFILNFFVSAVVCFYSLVDGDRFERAALSTVCSLVPEEEKNAVKEMFRAVDETLVSLWFGNFAFAVLVGIVSIPYFLIFHVPYVPMLSGLMFLAALIPVFAEWMVIVPVSMYLATVNLTSAIWFFTTGVIFFYILPELLLRPQFVGYASRIHPVLLLLAFIGGAIYGGAFGFFAAPTLVAILSAIHPFLFNQSVGEIKKNR